MKKEFPFSIRVDQDIFEGIEWTKKEHGWKKDSEAGRNILSLGIYYLKKAKEISENPKLSIEINQKMQDFMSSLYAKETIKDILKTFDDETIETIFSYSYLEDEQRKLEKEKELQQRIRIKNIAKNLEEEEELRKTTQHTLIIHLDNGKWVEIKCFKNIDNDLADANGNKLQKDIFLEPVNLPEGVEFLGEVPNPC